MVAVETREDLVELRGGFLLDFLGGFAFAHGAKLFICLLQLQIQSFIHVFLIINQDQRIRYC